MSESDRPNRIYQFGEFRLLPDERLLLRGKHRVSLTPRAFDLLRKLVENAGHLLTKEALMNEVWADSFVEEGNLNRTVSRLRKILGEKPSENRYIETIPRVGYRFIADVEVVTGPAESVKTFRKPEIKRSARFSRWMGLSLAAMLIISVAGAAWLWRDRLSGAEDSKKQKNVPIRLTDNSTDEERPYPTRGGSIRFVRWQGDQTVSFIMEADGTGQRRDTSIAGLRTGTWSPDERKVIFYKETDPTRTVYLADPDGSNEIRLPFVAGNFDWSPDSKKVVYQLGKPNSDIFLYTLETGTIENIVSHPAFDGDPSFSPDSNQIAFVSDRDGNMELYIQNLDGSDLRRLTNHAAHDNFPVFSPDGTQMAFASNREDENSDVYLINLNGSGILRLTNWKSNEGVFPGCWSADGTKLFFTSDQSGKDNIYVMNVEPFAPTRIIAPDGGNNLMFPSYSSDGQRVLFQTEEQDKSGEVRIFDLETQQSRVVVETESSDTFPAFSPDGEWIAHQCRSEGNTEICLVKPDGTGLKNLTNNPARDVMPAWSPDGTKIVFVSNRDGNYSTFQLYVMNADGGNQHRIYYSNAISQYPSWSPDGKLVAFTNDKEDGRSGNFEIFTIEPETAEAEKRLTFRRRFDVCPIFSPDGRRIAFVSDFDGNAEIYVMNADGSGRLRLTRDAANDTTPHWSPDGTRIIFSSNRDGNFAIYEIQF